jgi:uncharacterized protein with gpF-like domain
MWDGKGIDPWLPHRLAAESMITAAERKLYNAWWASFSDWMVRVKRGVLAGGAFPDVHAVWAFAPLWAEHMDAFVRGPVRDVVGLAFESLFGPEYHFDTRPRVTAYLAQVSNRMVRTPDHVFSVIAGQVARGAATGESIPTIAARVDEVLTTTGTEIWSGRAVTVARTETIGALNAGRQDAFTAVADELGGEFEQQWLATIDARTRPEHSAADGQRVPIGEPFIVGGEPLMGPGDPTGSAENVINCRCTTLLLRPDEDVDMTGRGFSDADEWWADQIDE